MNHNITTFTLTIPKTTSYDDLAPFFQNLVTRMPGISRLALKSHVPMAKFETHVIGLLSGMRKLRHVTFPKCHLPSRIIEQLSMMDHLEKILIDPCDERAFGDENGTEVFAPCLTNGAFPSLRCLSLRAHLGAIAQFMKSDFAPHAITQIHVVSCSPIPETSLDVEGLLSALANSCPNLRDLYLECLISFHELPDDPSSEFIVAYDALRPIFRPVLRSLEFSHPYPLHVTLDDINEIARNCSLLDTLILNCDPVILDSNNQLPLTALVPFARNCPDIKFFGLFFGASTSHLFTTEEDLEPFKKPIILTVGTSDIGEDVGPAKHFLSRICPRGCKVEVHVDWPGTFGDEMWARGGVEELFESREKRWDQVGCMLPILEKLRIKDRESVRCLEEKVKVMGEQLDAVRMFIPNLR
jgi:hypothetical protein